MTTPFLQANSNVNETDFSFSKLTQGNRANQYEQVFNEFLLNTNKLSHLLNEMNKSPKMLSALTVGQAKIFNEERVGRKESTSSLPRLCSLELSPSDTQVRFQFNKTTQTKHL